MKWLTTVMESTDDFVALTSRLQLQSAACKRDPRNTACIYASLATHELVWNDAAHALFDDLLELADVQLLSTPPRTDQLVRLTP